MMIAAAQMAIKANASMVGDAVWRMLLYLEIPLTTSTCYDCSSTSTSDSLMSMPALSSFVIVMIISFLMVELGAV